MTHTQLKKPLSVKRTGFLKYKIEYFVIAIGLGNSYEHPNVNTVGFRLKAKKVSITLLN